MQPTHILCNKEENTKKIVNQCLEITKQTHVSNVFTINDSINLINIYGDMFDKKLEANKLITRIQFKLNHFKSFIKEKPNIKVVYFIWRNPWMVAAKNTYINHLLELNKFENIYKNKERYPEIEIKKIRTEGDPDLILLSSEPYPFKEKHALELGRFTNHGKTIFVDGEMFSWQGSRLLKAFDYFITLRNSI